MVAFKLESMTGEEVDVVPYHCFKENQVMSSGLLKSLSAVTFILYIVKNTAVHGCALAQ